MSTTADKQQFAFQAEINQLLHILSQSLYQNREITIRELVSNASDALDKMRHVQLTDDAHRDDEPLEITLEPDREEKLLTIRDNGIGMTRDELVENLGTIAHSGSLAFLNKLSGDAARDVSLIGQFGVGFYSAFMLAERVEVLSRSCTEETGWRWESDGDGQFSVEPHEGLERGTQVRLHLRDDCLDFTGPERLKYVIEKYSTFVPHPIKLDDEQLNEQRPIWVEPKSQLKDEQYVQFFEHLSHRVDEKPLWYLHVSADSPLQFHVILYCPTTNFERLGFGRIEHGVHLCAKRILVQDDCRELLPDYLRFLYGIVDSADLPLNVARESLQDNTIFRKIRKVLVKRVLDQLDKLADQEADKYDTFYREFGVILREGIATDFENRERIAKLLRFNSTKTAPGKLVSLDEYVERAADEQKQIYFLTGPDAASMRQNPNLEIFARKDVEVLLLTDPVDEIMLSNLQKYDDKRLVSVDAADVELPQSDAKGESADAEGDDADKSEPESGFGKVLVLFKDALGDRVADVKQSKRLTDSPCCLVNPDGSMSAQLQKALQMSRQDFEMSKRILEINPRAPLIRRLCQLSSNSDHDEFIRNCGRQLFTNAMLLDGMAVDPQEAVARTQTFMSELAEKRSPIVM
ncbi:MAG: molecular chaperone HtpG [Planctomycetaceae bacterium]